jgi:hypothetical protein
LEFESRNPKWQQDDSPRSAELRELWSRYNQSLLGLSSITGKGLMDGSTNEPRVKKGFDYKKFRAEELAKYGPPPEGVSEIEHFVRTGLAEDEKAKAEAHQTVPVNSVASSPSQAQQP